MEGVGPWLLVVNPAVFMTYCAMCGDPFKKGDRVQRIEGGYGYRCQKCR